MRANKPSQSKEKTTMSLGNRQYVEQGDVLYENGGPVVAAVGGTPMVAQARGANVRASGLAFAGIVTILLGIWGGIIPFIGPSFGYSADGTSAWAMTSAHLWLSVIPGAIAFVAGCVLLMVAPRAVAGFGRGARPGGAGLCYSGCLVRLRGHLVARDNYGAGLLPRRDAAA